MASVDDPDMDIDTEEELEEEQDEEIDDGSVGSEPFMMDVEETTVRPRRFLPQDKPIDTSYGRPRLDGLPTSVMTKIANLIRLPDVMALRRTNKALNTFTRDTLNIWRQKVIDHRPGLLIGANPVVMPQHDTPGLPEELLRSAFILRRQWHNPAFQLASAQYRVSDFTPEGVEQILFVPDTLGRYFLVVSHKQVYLWTLEPNSIPQVCRRIFPWGQPLDEQEKITNVMLTRPKDCHVPYLAIQYTLKDSFRLRTEIYQLHLSKPRLNPADPAFGLVGTHLTEGALVAFTDFVLAYALGDPAQTILLCCWVTRQVTRLSAPVRGWEVRWQHQSCRAVAIGTDIIVVVRDSAAEVYPRELFTFPDEDQQPPLSSTVIIQGDLEYLPPTYATDIAVFPVTYVKTPKIYIHPPQSAISVSDGWSVDICVRPISIIGVARSPIPLTDPCVPYYVTTAKLFRTPTPQPSRVSTPNVSNPPSPSHTVPPSASHTAPNDMPPTPSLPGPERYKFVFHTHALQPQHPLYSYGPILAGPNGRGVMLVTNIGTGGGPKQLIRRFRHPANSELQMMIQPDGKPVTRPTPRILRMPQTNAHLPPQVLHHLPLHNAHPPPPLQPMVPAGHPPPPDPFAPLLPLMHRSPRMDIIQAMNALWATASPVGYELLAWDEGGGSLLVGSRRGDLAVLECAFPRVQPQPPMQAHVRAHSARA